MAEPEDTQSDAIACYRPVVEGNAHRSRSLVGVDIRTRIRVHPDDEPEVEPDDRRLPYGLRIVARRRDLADHPTLRIGRFPALA